MEQGAESLQNLAIPSSEPVEDVSSPSAKSPRRPIFLTDQQHDYLERRISNRPSASSLEGQGVLKSGGRYAAQRQTLQHELTSRVISKHLDQRPDHSDLVRSNIVESPGMAPGLQSTAKRLERQLIAHNLNQKLSDRNPEEHILRRDNVAPRLRDAKIKLQNAITRDQIGHLLDSRPDYDELIRQNILSSSPTASRIQGVQKQLQHHMTRDRIGHLLEKRSELASLQDQNILKDIRVAPSIQGVQRQLQQNLTKANLFHALKHRPTLNDLQKRGVYVDPEDGSVTYDAEAEPLAAQERYEQYETKEQAAPAYEPGAYQRRSKQFHLTRILLKFVASMAEAGEISLQQKSYLKDLIVDQDKAILAVAVNFDADNDIHEFKDSLYRLASRRV